jgi:hypothetical protein
MEEKKNSEKERSFNMRKSIIGGGIIAALLIAGILECILLFFNISEKKQKLIIGVYCAPYIWIDPLETPLIKS